jgi:hypothetical protein
LEFQSWLIHMPIKQQPNSIIKSQWRRTRANSAAAQLGPRLFIVAARTTSRRRHRLLAWQRARE